MSEFLAVPVKKPSDVDVIKPLKNLIQSAYSSSSADRGINYTDAVTEFSKLRQTAIWKAYEKFESSLEILCSYYDQLVSLETKIPAQELQIPFKYKDAFDKGSIFGGRMSLTLTSLAFEKVCTLFNIAALQSGIAASQSLENDDGLKMATKLFQQSAGIFNQLKALAPAAIPQEPTVDLTSEVLTILSNLMVAQAQEIFVMKAIKDSMKDIIIAKLACQAEELYADVLRGMQKESVRNVWDKEWVATIAGKQAGFHAMTQLYQSLECRASGKYGEEISRLQNAVELFKACHSRSGKPHLFEEFFGRAQRNLTETKKDNDMIYNEMIPDIKNLNPPGKAQLAKAIPPSDRLSTNFKDMFVELVPVALHQAITASEARKNEIVNAEVMKLREATQMLNSTLASLNLPAAIETTASGSGLPPSLLEKSREVRDNGGADAIRNLIKQLPESLDRNREILEESERLLNEERDSDNQLRGQFKERWSRTPSDKLTEMFRSNTSKYREIITNAINANNILCGKFDSNLHNIEILSKSPEEINSSVPCGNGVAISDCSSVQRLRGLLDTVETIKAERDVIESELKSATVDMKDQFLSALQQDGAINEPAISVSSIGLVLGPLQNQVQDSIQRQHSLISDIQAAHAQFTNETGAGTGSRDQLLSQLATAYDVFIELQNNLREGTKFYNDLTQLLVVFQNKISDYCFARKTEKDELLKDLTQESSRVAPAATPTVPAHHTNPSPPQQSPSNVPYPSQMHGMPVPYGATPAAPYPTYVPPPMPQGFNPYATLPYPNTPYNYQGFPQGPPPQHYGTYPGSYAHQQQQPPNQGGYPRQPPPPAGW
jgi:programmed cell death 6-interacting protein